MCWPKSNIFLSSYSTICYGSYLYKSHWLWVLFMMLSSKPIDLEKHIFFYPFKIQYMLNFVRLKRTIRVCLKYQEFTVCLSFLYNFEFVQLVLNNKPGKVHY